MKITYTPNPLRTIIELDDHEKKELWYKLKIENMVDLLFSVHYELTHKQEGPDMERVKKEVDPEYYLTEKERSPIDKRADELLEHYLEELRSNHVGDCTCFPMSCSKCHAEVVIGIDTTKGLGKHEAHKIQSAFDYKDGDEWKTRTLDEVLEILRVYEPGKPSEENKAAWAKAGGWEQHVPRWTAEAKAAYEWLLAYRDQHFPKEAQ